MAAVSSLTLFALVMSLTITWSSAKVCNNNICRPTKTDPPCNNAGNCTCDGCVCNSRKYGRYCECDDFACDFSDNQLCGGPDRGRCVCGECYCNERWTGEACGVSTMDTSYNDHSVGPETPDVCERFHGCAECRSFGTGMLSDEECARCEELGIQVKLVEQLDLSVHRGVPCIMSSKSCGYFGYFVSAEIDGRHIVTVQTKCDVYGSGTTTYNPLITRRRGDFPPEGYESTDAPTANRKSVTGAHNKGSVLQASLVGTLAAICGLIAAIL